MTRTPLDNKIREEWYTIGEVQSFLDMHPNPDAPIAYHLGYLEGRIDLLTKTPEEVLEKIRSRHSNN